MARPPRSLTVLDHGKRPHISDIAAVEITRGGMVHLVLIGPASVRRERQHGRDRTHDVARGAGAKERPVTAVMRDDEDADEKTGGQRRHGKGEPVGHREALDHQPPERKVR